MEANLLVKKSISIEDIYKEIEDKNKQCLFKHFIPHFIYVSGEIKLELMKKGFKVYLGDWDGIIKNALIIEW